MRHSDSSQQHPQPVSLKPLHAGLYGLAATGALLDDDDGDAEERYRRIQAEQEAKNFGAVIGVAAGLAIAAHQAMQEEPVQPEPTTEHDEPDMSGPVMRQTM